MRAPWCLAAVALSCAEPPAAQVPVAQVGSAAPLVADRGTSGAPASPKQPLDESCEPLMYSDIASETPRLSSFEDPSGRVGFRDEAGAVVIAPRFLFAYEFSDEGLAAVMLEDGPAFIDASGKVIARAFLFDNGPDYFVAGRARIVEQGKVGFIDRRGKVVVKPAFDHATSFCRARAAVCNGCRREHDGEHYSVVGGRWGFIDPLGRVVIPLHFEEASLFDEDGSAIVVEHGERMRIDRNGRRLPSPASR